MRRSVAGLVMVVLVAVGAWSGATEARAADPCPNASYRGGAAANLPDCRAWEQVTPVDKGGSQPDFTAGAYATPDGSRVMSTSAGNLGGANGGAYEGSFSSVRSAAWNTFGLDAPLDSPSISAFDILARPTVGYSDDRSKALVTSLAALAPGAVQGDSNLYVRDTADGSYTLAATLPGARLYSALIGLAGGGDLLFFASSPNFSHIAFITSEAVLPGALAGANNLYVVAGGRITLASRDSDENAFAAVTRLHPSSGQQLISDDGRRLTFVGFNPQTGGSFGLYQRVDGNSTVLISHSYRAGDDPDTPFSPIDTGVFPTHDGAQVTFGLNGVDSLTDDGPPSPFYRWRAGPNGGSLENLLTGVTRPWSPSAGAFALKRATADGRYLWFTLRDNDANGNTVVQLDLLDTVDKDITTVATAPDPNFTGTGFFDYDSARFSPDGTKLVVLSPRELTNYDQANPNCSNLGSAVCAEVFLFDTARPGDGGVCVSCGPAGSRSVGDAGIGQGAFGRPLNDAVTNSGTVFFSTPQALAPGDSNALSDVYKYEPGQGTQLISSGTGSRPARLAGTTPSGRDAFFFTADPLVPQDNDDAVDVYDARVGGGIAAQQVPSGNGDACPAADCRGAQTPAASAQLPGTSTLQRSTARPSFTVARVSSAARRRAVSTGRLEVAIRVGAAGRLSAHASARLGARSSTVARSAVLARKAGRYTLTLRLSASARRALARDRRLAVALSVSYSRASKSKSQRFTLVAPRTRSTKKGGAR